MYRTISVLGFVFLAVVVVGCMNKYAILKATNIPNPPTEKVRVYIGEIEESRKNLNPQKQDKKSYKEEIEARLKQPELHVLSVAAGPEDLESEKVVPNFFVLVEEKKDAQLEIRGSVSLLGVQSGKGTGPDSTVTSYEILITVKDMLTYDDVYTSGRSSESHFIHDTPEQRRAFGDLFLSLMVEKAIF